LRILAGTQVPLVADFCNFSQSFKKSSRNSISIRLPAFLSKSFPIICDLTILCCKVQNKSQRKDFFNFKSFQHSQRYCEWMSLGHCCCIVKCAEETTLTALRRTSNPVRKSKVKHSKANRSKVKQSKAKRRKVKQSKAK
jgi:hypothetical protein